MCIYEIDLYQNVQLCSRPNRQQTKRWILQIVFFHIKDFEYTF